MLGDSISYAYVDYASQAEGKIDYIISSGYGNYKLNITNITDTIKANPTLDADLTDYLPRSHEWRSPDGLTIYSVANTTDLNKTERVIHFGVDIAKETTSIHGPFLYDSNGSAFTGTLGRYDCLLAREIAHDLDIEDGDTVSFINITYKYANMTEVSNKSVENYTVKAVIDYNYKLPDYADMAIIMNLSAFNAYWNRSIDDVRELILNLKHPEDYYDTTDVDGTIERLREKGILIQNELGFYNRYGDSDSDPDNDPTFYVDMPRVGILEISQYINVGISIILLFISILGMVISGILINGILTTSIEEKIREYGIFRVLGSHRSLPIKITVTQAFILSGIGTSLGMLGAWAMTEYVLLPLIANLAQFTIGEVTAILSTQTIALSVGVGMGMSMIVGIAPALKASRMSILGAINPYRKETVGTKMVKEGSLNLKYILIGVITTGNATFVLYIVPQILLTLDIGLIVAVLIILLTTFLLGATVIGLGLIPAIQKVVHKLFTIFSRKTREITRISLLRYTRRNTTTVLMFSIAFSFITLVSTVLKTTVNQNTGEVMNRNGSDLVVDTRSNIIEDYIGGGTVMLPNQSFANDLLQYEGISKISTILATTDELPIVQGVPYSLTVSDRVRYRSSDVQAVAIDENYLETVYNQYCLFYAGNMEQAFEDLFSGDNNIIVSTGLATTMQISLNDRLLLDFTWGEDGETVTEEFVVIGIADNMAGISSITKTATTDMMSGGGGIGIMQFGDFDEGGGMFGGMGGGGGPGVLMSQEIFKQYFQLPAMDDFYTSKIFIKLGEDYQNADDSEMIEEQIILDYGETHLFDMDNSYTQGEMMRQIFFYIELLFTLILSFAVVISLFGLTSAAYSTIVERMREVGIIETLGLRKLRVSNMFIIESEIIMVSAALMGAIVGITLVAIFYWQIASFSSFPVFSAFTIPWDTIAIELAVAGIACLISMLFLVKRVQRKSIIEIFRETL